jgi:hypothetical protein
MNSKWPDILCTVGVALIGGSLWAIHPAVTCGFAGAVLVLIGLRLLKIEHKETKH